MIASGLMIDLLIMTFFMSWINGGSFRFVIALFLIYLIRWNCGWWAIIHAKGGNQWSNPGFPSLFVSYKLCNNTYYFNPVIGVLTALVAEYRL